MRPISRLDHRCSAPRGADRARATPRTARRGRLSPGNDIPGWTEHSQITITRQPSLDSAATTRRSRLRLAANFAAQYAIRVRGTVASLHRPWRCQKHPCTRMAVRSAGSTMSGVPGSARTLRRKRNPLRCSALRTIRSGPVSLPRMLRMMRLRTSGDTRSAIAGYTISVAGFSRYCRTVCRYSAAIAPSITR